MANIVCSPSISKAFRSMSFVINPVLNRMIVDTVHNMISVSRSINNICYLILYFTIFSHQFPEYRLIAIQRKPQQATNKTDQPRILKLESLAREKTLYDYPEEARLETPCIYPQLSSSSLFEDDRNNATHRIQDRLCTDNRTNNVSTPGTRPKSTVRSRTTGEPPDKIEQNKNLRLPPISTRSYLDNKELQEIRYYAKQLQSSSNNKNKQEAIQYAEKLMNYGAHVNIGFDPMSSQPLTFRYEHSIITIIFCTGDGCFTHRYLRTGL